MHHHHEFSARFIGRFYTTYTRMHANSLYDAYFESPDPTKASHIIKQATDVNVIKNVWNALVTTSGPNLRVLKDALTTCEKNDNMQEALEIWLHTPTHAFIDSFSFAKLCFFCAKVGNVTAANMLFDILQKRNIHGMVRKDFNFYNNSQNHIANYNRIIQTYLGKNQLLKAMEVFQYMLENTNVRPDSYTFGYLLLHCSRVKDATTAMTVYTVLKNSGVAYDLISINTLISLLVKCDQFPEAVVVYDDMIKRSVAPDSITYLALLNGSADTKNYACGKKFYDDIIHRHIILDVKLVTPAIRMFIMCDKPAEAVALYQQVKKQVKPNAIMFITLLTACSDSENYSFGWQLYLDLKSSNIVYDVPLTNVVMRTLIYCGKSTDAKAVYETMMKKGLSPTPITYIVLLTACIDTKNFEMGKLFCKDMHKLRVSDIKALVLEIALLIRCKDSSAALHKLRNLNTSLDSISFITLMAACADSEDYEICQALYKYFKTSSFDKRNLNLINALINMFFKCEKAAEASRIYEEMLIHGPAPDAVTYNSVLLGCANTENYKFGWQVYENLRKSAIAINIKLQTVVIKLLVKCGKLDEATRLHEECIANGPAPDAMYYGALMTVCADTENYAFGKRLLHDLEESDIEQGVTLKNATINMLIKCNYVDEALKIYHNMLKFGPAPDNISYIVLLLAAAETDNYKLGEQLCTELNNSALQQDIKMKTVILNMLLKCGKLEQALRMENEMVQQGIVLDDIAYATMLAACADISARSFAQAVHELIKKRRIDSITVNNALINMYGKCGMIEKALQIFSNMRKNNVKLDTTSWSTMIYACSLNRRTKQALDFLDEMQKVGYITDSFAVVGALNACSHGLETETAINILGNMESKYGIIPDTQIYNIVVDTLARAGQLERAENFIAQIPEPNHITYMALLGGCKKYKDVSRAERVAKKLQELVPDNPASYILLGNTYSQELMWDDRKKLMTLMESRKLRKKPGRSYVYIEKCEGHQSHDSSYYGRSYSFLVEDIHHPLIGEIHALLKKLRIQIQERGYVADVSCVTRKIDSYEERVNHLWSHSEKLALGLVLLLTPEGMEATITKNLRSCWDCHEAIRQLTCILDRKINLRDASSWHELKDGKCSCNSNY